MTVRPTTPASIHCSPHQPSEVEEREVGDMKARKDQHVHHSLMAVREVAQLMKVFVYLCCACSVSVFRGL